MSQEPSSWDSAKVLSVAILYDRVTRRKWLGAAAFLMLALFVAGIWFIQDWLAESLLRFTVWWLCFACYTGVVLLFALYDALRTLREEREKVNDEREGGSGA